jgi:hypothetical protein
MRRRKVEKEQEGKVIIFECMREWGTMEIIVRYKIAAR